MLLNTILRSKAHQEVVMKKLKIKPKQLKWNLFGERGRIGRVKLQVLKKLCLDGISENSIEIDSGIFLKKVAENDSDRPLRLQK